MTDIPIVQHYIGGRYLGSRSESLFETVNPATGEVLAHVDEAHTVDVDVAVAAAKEGFRVWRAMTGAERGRILIATAHKLRERVDELAKLEVQDTGKPIAEAREVDVFSAADCLEYFGGLAASLHGEHFDLGPQAFAYTRREPLGVCLGIGAWNYPIQIAAWKSAPALAAGNAMIFKPSEMTPLTAPKLAEIFTECGLPDGVFNVVQGKGETGQALVAHSGIRKVSLTGSVPTGRKVMRSAAATLKHVTMELGGKSPLIVFEDAHLDNAVSAAMMANFYTQGEICSNGTRVFVERSVMDTFVEKAKARAEAMKIGDPMADDTDMGSLISSEHLDKVMGYIAKGLEEGADLVTGGERVTDGELAKGSFVRPTIFTGCRDRMAIVREEIFGPVMCILPFDSEEEVVKRANDTDFGLAAGVFTKDIQRAHRVVAELEAGTCWINNYNITPIEMPFGGVKQSGLGRENSLTALHHYTELKSVYVELGDVEAPY
ncbi:MAG: betaine-aldehyde dehydrogenase [Myxococcota bacterium]|nr:betaine-aldehyde dehydrogenase [Myxococcota bacterium]